MNIQCDTNTIKTYNNDLQITETDYLRLNDYVKEKIQPMKLNVCLNDYSFVKRIGEGTFGFVDLCKRNNKMYVLKIIEKTENVIVSDVFTEIFLQSTLKHTKIVKCRGWFEDSYNYYMELEYIEGYDLFEKAKHGVDSNYALYVIHEVLDILLYLKTNRVIHRDIKLENILIGETDEVYLCDFGLSLITQDKSDTVSDKRFVGTLEYVSPEAIESFDYSYKTDIWSIGIMLYELIYRRYPFDNDNRVGCFNSDSYDVLKRIKKMKIKYENGKPDGVNSFLKKIFVKKNNRLTVEQCLNDELFKTLDISSIKNKSLTD